MENERKLLNQDGKLREIVIGPWNDVYLPYLIDNGCGEVMVIDHATKETDESKGKVWEKIFWAPLPVLVDLGIEWDYQLWSGEWIGNTQKYTNIQITTFSEQSENLNSHVKNSMHYCESGSFPEEGWSYLCFTASETK